MNRVRLRSEHIRIGSPLSFDVYDADGHMLLCRGYVVEDENQLERLIERGAYSDVGAIEHLHGSSEADPAAELTPVAPGAHRRTARVSVFALIMEIAQRLEALLSSDEGDAGFVPALLETGHMIQRACELDTDAALAHILVGKAIRYPTRQLLNVAVLAEILLKQLGKPESERLLVVAGGLTMNVTMLALQEIVYHQNAPLTPDQKRTIWDHPRAGSQWLRDRGVEDAVWLDVVAQHHEGSDGSGYPAKLQGEAIRQEAQIISLADRYCGMVSERAYRAGVMPNVALREIFVKQGAAIDTRLAALLVKEVGIYPPGTFVLLANGESGIVVKRTLNANQPVVRALLNANGKRYPDPPKRLTNKDMYAVANVRPAEKLGIEIDCEQLWAPAVTDASEADVQEDREA